MAGIGPGAGERPSLADRFQRDGFLCLRSVLDPVTIEAALAHLGRLGDSLGARGGTAIVAAPPGDLVAGELAGDDRVAGLAGAILGSGAEPFGFTYLCKPARSGLPARWHQDGEPWAARLKGAAALTVWVALTPADETSGCLVVIPASHGLDAQPLSRDLEGESLFGVGMDPALVDEGRAMPLPVDAGDVVVHHPNLIHRSGPNRSPKARTALAIRYRTRC